jgi:hypothetical protein
VRPIFFSTTKMPRHNLEYLLDQPFCHAEVKALIAKYRHSLILEKTGTTMVPYMDDETFDEIKGVLNLVKCAIMREYSGYKTPMLEILTKAVAITSHDGTPDAQHVWESSKTGQIVMCIHGIIKMYQHGRSSAAEAADAAAGAAWAAARAEEEKTQTYLEMQKRRKDYTYRVYFQPICDSFHYKILNDKIVFKYDKGLVNEMYMECGIEDSFMAKAVYMDALEATKERRLKQKASLEKVLHEQRIDRDAKYRMQVEAHEKAIRDRIEALRKKTPLPPSPTLEPASSPALPL